MKAEYNPEKLMRIERQKGPLPNSWKARAMAHQEDIGRTNAVLYRKYLISPADTRSQFSKSALSFFGHLADCGVPPEYLEKYGELTAEAVAEIQDFHREVSEQSDVGALTALAEDLRKEIKKSPTVANLFQRDKISQTGPIESLPPEYINTNTKNIVASLKLSIVESQMEELGQVSA